MLTKENSNYAKIINGFFAKPVIKKTIEIVLPLILSVAIAFIFVNLSVTLFLGIPTLIIYIISTVKYCKMDIDYRKKQKDLEIEIKELQEKNDNFNNKQHVYDRTLISIKAILETASNNIEKLMNNLSDNKDVIDKNNIWSFKQTVEIICQKLLEILTIIYKAKIIEISFIVRQETKNELLMVAYENTLHEEPSIFNKGCSIIKRFKQQKNKYMFQKIFYLNKKDPYYLLDKNKIKESFWFGSSDQKENCKYDQYIAIPINNSLNNIIGLLQISTINVEKEYTQEFWSYIVTSIIKPLTQTIQLSQKVENCINYLTKEVNNE